MVNTHGQFEITHIDGTLSIILCRNLPGTNPEYRTVKTSNLSPIVPLNQTENLRRSSSHRKISIKSSTSSA